MSDHDYEEGRRQDRRDPDLPRNQEAFSQSQAATNYYVVGYIAPDYRFTNMYWLRWDTPKETAYPATFLIDAKGTVFFVKIVREHGGRTTAAEVLDALPKAQSMQ